MKNGWIWGIDLVMGAALLLFLFALPATLFHKPTSFVVEDVHGNLLSASIASDGQWRFPEADTVPTKFIACIRVFEDKRFFVHPGVDFLAMGRAMRQNLASRAVVSGGSTLSMQVIRLSRRKERTLLQKLAEVMLSFRLELGYSKTDIMKLYAANAPFGTNVVGLEAAAWRYYGRAPEVLSWGEMATLAVLPNSPTLVRPGKNTAKLIRKRNLLLDKLAQQGIIDKETAQLSKLEPVPGVPLPLPQLAPHLLTRFKKEQLKNKSNLTRLVSTLDQPLQLKISALLKHYNNRYRANDINNIAALVVDVPTGAVKAYVGNHFQPELPALESHVDMIAARRSPGSILKPLLYSAMLTDGIILPQTLIPDIPTQIAGYVPQNFDLGYDGAIAADKALSRSLNIPAVKMLQQYKYERFYAVLKKLGLTTLNQPADHYGLSLILGGSEVTMWDMAKIYLGAARSLNHYNRYKGAYDPEDYEVLHYRSVAAEKEKLYERNGVLDHAAIWATFNAMEEVMRPGDEGLWEQFNSASRIAWKTGTSFGFRDGWAIGVTGANLVCVWVGNADGEGRPGLTGIETAAPVMFDIFRLLPAQKWFPKPQTKLIKLNVCKISGYKAGEYCPRGILETAVAGNKTGLCPYHSRVHLNATGTFRVTDACESPARMVHQNWFILPPAMEYYYKVRHPEYKSLPPFAPGCTDMAALKAMELIYPKANAAVYIPLEADGSRGKVVFTAAHREMGKRIFWHIDDTFIGSTVNFHQLAVNPTKGRHLLTLVDEAGARITQYFTVLDKEQKNRD